MPSEGRFDERQPSFGRDTYDRYLHRGDAMSQEHLCVVCQKRPYERAQVCDPDRGRLPHILTEIVELCAQLPEVLERAQSAGQRVSGSREAPAPVSLDVVDLDLPARAGVVSDTLVPATRVEIVEVRRRYVAVRDGEPSDVEEVYSARQRRIVFGRQMAAGDQVGYISVPSILDQWVRDWRDEMAFAQSLPLPTVAELARWLKDRVEWACDRHPAIDEFAAEMVKTRGILRAVLGLSGTSDDEEYCDGVVCKSCDRFALYRDGKYVECDRCGLLYTEAEYAEWVGLLDAQTKHKLRSGELEMPDDVPAEVRRMAA